MERKILVLTDDSVVIRNLAANIASSIKNQPAIKYSVSVLEAARFSAVDLLPAHAFFLGCEKPRSFAFPYIEDLFAHINLAGRSCGIFSSSATAIKYLASLVRPSEANVGKPLLAVGDAMDGAALQNWAMGIVQEGYQ